MNKLYTATLIAFLLPFFVQARHIIGGDVTYVCLGNNTYEFTIKVYRDCEGGGADFDDPAYIAIYRGNNEPYELIEDFEGFLDSDVDIPPEEKPCLEIPPGVCVEEGIYQFTRTLDQSPESYHIVYQRCCRNNTITNIVNPEDSGATFAIELTGEAQIQCNNTPSFNDFPPIVICAGEPISFDHTATDVDGDQLVYELCSPILGGGPVGGTNFPGNAAGCDGIRPNPSCPPPFDDVEFLIPTYSALNPIGGDPALAIDPNTGLLTGTPTITGQFVVGVCVSEYRNGILLSTVSRDFQFNVTECDVAADANIVEDSLFLGPLSEEFFEVNSCGDPSLLIINESEVNIADVEALWVFDFNDGTIDSTTTWNANVDFPGPGTYTGFLYLNPGEECGDTANIIVNIYDEIVGDFTFDYDTCVAGPVAFQDLSLVGNDPPSFWEWNFGNGFTADEPNPVFSFTDPGLHPVNLFVADPNGCSDTISKVVNWFPVPPLIIVEPTTYVGCPPLSVSFTNLSTPIDTSYQTVWDFGDGNTSSDINATHIYPDPGTYTISLEITSPIGCFTDTTYTDWIEVVVPPVADFTWGPDLITNFSPEVNFEDQSVDAIAWGWDFNGESFSYEQNPNYVFADTGLQTVQLIVGDQYNCQDTITKIVDIVPQITYFLPNAFTPNNDGKNELFRGGGYFRGLQNFSMMIWDRYGGVVFESSDPSEGWNGRFQNTGKLMQRGVYVCIVRYDGPRGKPYEMKGFATLVK